MLPGSLLWGIISIGCFMVSASKNSALSEIIEKKKRRRKMVLYYRGELDFRF